MEIKKMAIYARQSRAKETNGSIEDQILSGKERAKFLNKEYQIYTDRGLSAAGENFDNRPAFKELIKDITEGKIDVVFVKDCSRLTRNPTADLFIKETFQRYNVIIHSQIEGIIDYKDSNGELMAGLFAILNRKTLRDNTEKIKAVLANRARDGKAHTGILKPYGYTACEKKFLIVDDTEALVVKRIFDYSLKGYGSQKIAEILNAENIPTKGRKLLKNGITKNKGTSEEFNIPNEKLFWRGNTVLSILKNPLYKGSRLYKGETIKSPMIISTEEWDEVQLNIKSNTNRQGDLKHQYLLKNLCKCAICGSNIVGRTRENKRDHYYYCASKVRKQSCGFRSLNIDFLDEVVWYAISNSTHIQDMALEEIEKLRNPNHIEEIKNELVVLEKSLKNLDSSKQRILRMFELQHIDEDELGRKMSSNNADAKSVGLKIICCKEKINENQNYINGFNRIINFQNTLNKLKYNIGFDDKRMLINTFVEKVLLDFDTDNDTYTIRILVKLPRMATELYDYKEDSVFYLKKGESPNLLIRNHKNDLNNNHIGSEGMPFEKIEKQGKTMFRNTVKFPKKTFHQVELSNITNGMMWRAVRADGH